MSDAKTYQVEIWCHQNDAEPLLKAFEEGLCYERDASFTGGPTSRIEFKTDDLDRLRKHWIFLQPGVTVQANQVDEASS